MGSFGNGSVLAVTSLDDVTADMVIRALVDRNTPVVRLDPADIGPDQSVTGHISDGCGWSGRLTTMTRAVELSEIRSVYWRRPSPWRYADLPAQALRFARAEAQHGLFGLLAALPVAYVSNPTAIAAAEYKPIQLAVAGELGFSVPATLVSNDLRSARRFAEERGPVVYKTFRGVPASDDGHLGAVWTQRVTVDELDESISVCPHLFQAEVPKSADVRVTVVGDRVFATEIHSPGGSLDWRAGDWAELEFEPIQVPASVAAMLLAYLARFGLAFGAFDLIIDPHRRWWWIECNPNGQWGFLPDADSIAEALADLLIRGEDGPC